jgi:phosphatidylinositol alpha-1,6-mannosyltransferase
VKILYLTPGCFDKGGISRYSRYQINALRALVGADNVSVFSVLGPSKEDFEDPFDVRYFAGGTGRFHQLAYLGKLCSTVISNRPDIIVSAHINLSGIGKFLSMLTGAKSILNIYGAEAWSTKTRDAAWGLRRSDYVVSDCHYTASYLEEKGFRPKNSVAVVWDCVDLTRFFPAQPAQSTLERYGIPDPRGGINILTLGRMGSDTAEYKGYERLLEVFSRIADQVAHARLIYAGRGEMVERLRRKAEDLGLSRRVFFTGMVHEDDLPDIYRSAHLFSLVTNRGEGVGEGIPLTPLEAAACGIPLIVGNHDGSQEAVEEGLDGYILDPYDLEAHARALVSLATNEELRTRMGQAARRRAELEFAFPKFLKKHAELLARWFSYEFASPVLQKDVAQTVSYL